MKRKIVLISLLSLAVSTLSAQTKYDYSRIQMERLDRGVVAVRTSADSVMVSWRYLTSDRDDTWFEVYRNGKKVANVARDHGTYFMDYNPSPKRAKYVVKAKAPVGSIAEGQGEWTLPANAPLGYIDIPLQRPTGYKDVEGNDIEYIANDASVADLDGDGQLEIVLKWDPSNSRDNSQSGITNNTFIDAYKMDGRRLWRIDLGRNIRSGAHYTQFMVYDLDGDGRAEMVVKTGDGTVDGQGRVIGDANADYRVGMEQRDDEDYHATYVRGELFRKDQKGRRGGFINRGPEYLTVFDGLTGAEIHTVDYVPERGDLRGWGDNYANRSDRFLACVAYLDGVHPSVVMCRGYYARTVLAAWDFDGKRLRQRWVFDSNNEERIYAGQGNHNLRVADVDGDGRDEITYGSMAVDDDGTGLYSTNFGHGDAIHLMPFFPLDDRLQVWDCHENKRDGSDFRDAATGQVIFQLPDKTDVGRCMAADIDPGNPGVEMWSSRSGGLRNVNGEIVDSLARVPINMAVWWDGDLLREMLDHETVSKYIPKEHACRTLTQMYDCQFNNGTKSNPCLAADIVGDWREEVLTRTRDNEHLRLYVTPMPTPYRFHTFLQDPVYRHSVTTQNVAYNQPTNVGFYFGAELEGSGKMFRGWQFKDNSTRIFSPDRMTYADVRLAGGRLSYSAGIRKVVGKDTIDVRLLEDSPLGLYTNVADFTRHLALTETGGKSVRYQYDLWQSKQSHVDATYTHRYFTLQTPQKKTFTVDFRVGNHDIAYRYNIPQQGETAAIVVKGEATGFRLPKATTTFLAPQCLPMSGWKRTKPSYEEEYTPDEPINTPSKYGQGYTFPCLFHVGDAWVLISETGLDGRYCASHLSDGQNGLYTIAFPMEGENNGFGSVGAQFGLPGSTPWRTITLGETLAPIVETTVPWDVIEQLYEPNFEYDGGRSTWSWIIWQDESIVYDDQVAFINLAADLGWEYCLIDGGWETNIGRERMEQLFDLCRQKGIHPFVWYNSNGGWNDAPQCAKQRMYSPIVRKKEMKWLHEHGVKGIKVDFFAGDKQETIKLYEQILSDANDYDLRVIFHGCTLPRGWERMYPNYVGSEAVLASENLVFNQHFDDMEGFNATLHPFCRNAVGAMEFGGTILQRRLSRDNQGGRLRKVSDVFELGTAIVFQSAVQNFALTPMNLDPAVTPTWEIDFMRQVPTTWDETRFIDGYPGKYIIMARRHGEHWYVAALNALHEPLSVDVPLPMLAGRQVKWLDDQSGIRQVTLDKNGTLKAEIPAESAIVLY